MDIVERLKHLVALGDLDAARALGVEAWRRGDLKTLKEASRQPLWRPSEERWKAAPISPRLWQQQALVRIVKHFQNRVGVVQRESAPTGDSVGDKAHQTEGDAIAPAGAEEIRRGLLVQAVMGAGKSHLIGALLRSLWLWPHQTVVVTTSTRQLVGQLHACLCQWLDPQMCGRYFSGAKQVDRPVIVACNPSAPRIAASLKAKDKEIALWIADEAHRTQCTTIKEAARILKPQMLMGFTATPWRGNDEEMLSLFDTLYPACDFARAIQENILSDFQVVPWTGKAGSPIDEACWEMMKEADGPGIISAEHIEDAETFAALLRGRGFLAEAVHSQQSPTRQREVMGRLERGELRAVVHVNLLTEGADFPFLRWLCLRRQGCSDVRFPQEVGRVLRWHPDKTQAVIYDPRGHFESHTLLKDARLYQVVPVVVYLREMATVSMADAETQARALIAKRDYLLLRELREIQPQPEGVAPETSASIDILKELVNDAETLDVIIPVDRMMHVSVRLWLMAHGVRLHVLQYGARRVVVYAVNDEEAVGLDAWVQTTDCIVVGQYRLTVEDDPLKCPQTQSLQNHVRVGSVDAVVCWRRTQAHSRVQSQLEGVRSDDGGALTWRFLVEEEQEQPQPPIETNDDEQRARQLEELSRWLLLQLIDFEKRGVARRYVAEHEWRDQPPSARQLEVLMRAAQDAGVFADAWPAEFRSQLRQAYRVHRRFQRGAVSDLIGILKALIDAKGWPANLVWTQG